MNVILPAYILLKNDINNTMAYQKVQSRFCSKKRRFSSK